jgi:hypothetical protein
MAEGGIVSEDVQEEQGLQQEPSLDELIERKRQKQMDECQTAIALALAQHSCELIPVVTVIGDKIQATVKIRVKE